MKYWETSEISIFKFCLFSGFVLFCCLPSHFSELQEPWWHFLAFQNLRIGPAFIIVIVVKVFNDLNFSYFYCLFSLLASVSWQSLLLYPRHYRKDGKMSPFFIFILSWRVLNEAMFVPMNSRIWNPTKPPRLLDEYHRAAYDALWLNVDYRCDQTVISRARAVIQHYCAAP